MMGGSICFNKASCEDYCLKDWMSITKMLKGSLGVDEATLSFLLSGTPVPLDFLAASLPNPGYLPLADDHPMAGRRGLFFPSCT